MSQKTTITKRNTIEIYDHNKMIIQTFALIQKDLSPEHYDLAKRYDIAMVKDALGKAARLKQLKMFLSLSRILKKDWGMVTKSDIDNYSLQVRFINNFGRKVPLGYILYIHNHL